LKCALRQIGSCFVVGASCVIVGMVCLDFLGGVYPVVVSPICMLMCVVSSWLDVEVSVWCCLSFC
jgi:hypothetical protein